MSINIIDPQTGLKEKMTRRERREWYRVNRKKLGLPRWSELSTLKDEQQQNGK